MAEISHVRMGVPEQATLNRLLREGGAQAFPQWLYAEPAPEPTIAWWGVRGAPLQLLDPPADPARTRLFPRPFDDWGEAPRGLVLVTADSERAARELAPALRTGWLDAGEDDLLAARCRRTPVGRAVLVLGEPSAADGYAARCLERDGEGPIAVALDGTTAAGRTVLTNPVDGGTATYVRIGPGASPTLIFLPAR
ncbi:MAG TPA: hypothetical protein VHK06_01575 [Candidatus Limnocylindria bacterium]|nr:hypothetical protein [Candidatus Limnocylindria bacterium]